MKQVVYMFGAIVLGILFPFGYRYTFLVQYLVMLMLFFAFLDISLHSRILTRLHFKVLAGNLLLPLLLFALFYPLGYDYAISAFVVAVGPTAAGAPVLTEILRADVAFVTVSVILTSPAVALALPFMLPPLLGPVASFSILDLLLPILSLVFIPLILGQALKRWFPFLYKWALRGKPLSFPLFVANIFIACGKATHFIRTDETTSLSTLWIIAALTAAVCVIHFQIGQYLGGKSRAIEGSMALGRKNTMFSIWLALTFVSPVAALAPIFYILFQNLYNSWQIWAVSRESSVTSP